MAWGEDAMDAVRLLITGALASALSILMVLASGASG
jgi:hypothetical protein